MIQTDVPQFKLFHECLTKDHPEYVPFYFPLNPNSKDPLENKSWKKNQQTFEQACKYLELGYNIGIAATDTDRLVIMDKDDLKKVGAAKTTLTITSRKRIGEHSFYFTDDKIASNIFEDSAKQNIATETAGEIRANWQYVVCAGSFVPVLMDELDDEGNKIWDKIPDTQKEYAGKYTVKETLPVNTISFHEFPEVYKQCLIEKREDDLKKRLPPIKKDVSSKNDKHKSALFDLTIENVTGKNENGSLRFPSLFHGSATGANSSIKDGMFHCWRHSVSHSPLTALAVVAGFGDCSKLGFAHHGRGTSSIDLSDGETQFKLWDYAKKNKILPDDDPIPTKAMVWYAVHEKLCSSSDIVDGWKLPTPIYNLTIQKLHEAGIIPGREKYIAKRKDKSKTFESDNIQTCSMCLFKPRGGAGGCRNQLNDDEKHKKKSVVYDTPKCEHFKEPENRIQSSKKDDEISAVDIATQVLKKYPIITLVDNPAEMYYYENGVYNYGAENKIREYAQTLMDADSKKTIIQEVIYFIQNETFIKRSVINSQKNLINLKNGYYNLDTKQLESHSSTVISTCQIPINYNPAAVCPEISRFLCEVLRPRDIALIIQAIGYCLIPDYSIQKAILLNGSGLNGKGTLGRLMAKALGDENISSESLKALNTDKFSAANLYGKLINIDMDLTAEAVHEDSVFKKLTGGDMIPAERKFQNRFEFRNIARLFFGCNDIPQHKKGGYAYFRRWIIVDFPVKFSGESENKNLDAKLQTPEELSGFLNLCLLGLHWLLESKTFYYDKTPEQVGEEYLIKSNSVMAFMKEYTIPADDYVTTANLYQAYITWGKYMHIKKIEPSNTFGQMLKHGGYNQVRPYVDGKQTPAYEGFVIDYTKLAKIESAVNHGISRAEETTQNTLNQIAYRHWFNKDCELSKVSRAMPQIIQCMINYIHVNPLRNDNDIVELLSRTYLEHSPTYPTKKQDKINKNDMPKHDDNFSFKKTALLTEETEQSKITAIALKNEIGVQPIQTNLIELIQKAQIRFQNEKGIVNSANINIFSIWLCEQYKPQWQANGESGYYEPSAIKGISSKLFGLTPDQL